MFLLKLYAFFDILARYFILSKLILLDVNSAKIETKDIRHLGEPVAPGAREQDPTGTGLIEQRNSETTNLAN